MTVEALIKSSLRALGKLGVGESLDTTLSADALTALNILLNEWSGGETGIYARAEENFSLTASQGSYTWGSGANFDSARPTRLKKAWILSGGTRSPVKLRTEDQMADISSPATEGQPRQLSIRNGYPSATVTLYPVPDSAYTLYLQSDKPLAQYAATTDQLNLPPEYEAALKWCLAVDLAPDYRAEVPATVAFRAREALDKLQALHREITPLDTDVLHSNGGGYRIDEG